MNLDLEKLESGDIIFTSIPNKLYQCVEQATNSQASHVGIVIKRRGQWVVAESRVPFSCYTPLDQFIGRSKDDWFRIKRLKRGLSEEQKRNLKTYCDSNMRKLYHLGFKYQSKRQFCSKFVYDAYKEVLGVEIGELETFDNLLSRNPDTPQRFWRAWFFGFIPWQRMTITPESQYSDLKLISLNL